MSKDLDDSVTFISLYLYLSKRSETVIALDLLGVTGTTPTYRMDIFLPFNLEQLKKN